MAEIKELKNKPKSQRKAVHQIEAQKTEWLGHNVIVMNVEMSGVGEEIGTSGIEITPRI